MGLEAAHIISEPSKDPHKPICEKLFAATLIEPRQIHLCPKLFMYATTIKGSVHIVTDENPDKATHLDILTVSQTMFHEFMYL
jgi:hypothetical protein